MMKHTSFSLNGRATGASAFVKDKIAHALTQSNLWSVTENNKNNSWNVNFNNGNTNNNNKNNNNVGRAVSALGEEEWEGWIEAADDCCRDKKTGLHCTEYRIREELLVSLVESVASRTYKPLVSECFVVKKPKLREIFAAHFLDRIVQHWIILRIEPLLEKLFVECGDVSFNCRKGYGTLRAVRHLEYGVQQITEGYTKSAWIGKFDLQSFFMSIDKNRLWEMLREFIETHYHESDKDTLLWLAEITIKHRPQDNCIRKGDLSLWDRLPRHKSLFTMDGMAIGNITSQILANFYLSELDRWMNSRCKRLGGCYVRFVDDMVIVLPEKKDVLSIYSEAKRKVSEELGLTFHPDKVYVQHATKGVKFVGSVIKPNRTYLSNRTVAGLRDMLSAMEKHCKTLATSKRPTRQMVEDVERDICSCNSYMGFLIHHHTYGIRRRMLGHLCWFWKVASVDGHYNKVKMKNVFNNINRV